MAITRYAGDRFTIAAGETKPTGVLDGGYLIDTGNLTQFVKRTVAGASEWTQLAGGGGGGSPGGSNTQVQFNNAGSFGGNANLTFDGSKLSVNTIALSGIIYDSNNSIGNGGMVLTNEGTTGVNWKSIESVLSGVGGSGVANYVARWSDEDTLTSGIIYDNASKVGISTASPQAELHVYAGTTAGDHLLVESTNTAAGDAPDLVLYRNSPSPANSDDLGIIRFRGKNDGTDTGFEENKVIYADIEAEITSVVSGSEGAALKFYTQDNGSLASRMVITGSNVGIGTVTPATPLHITKSAVGDNEVPEVIRLSTLNSASPSWSTTDGLCIGAEMKKANGTTITKQPIKFRYDGGDMATTLEEGKVGIGTATPAAKLDIRSSDSVVAYIIRPSASPTVHIGSATSAGAQIGYVHASDYAFFGHDAAFNAIVVNSSGSVGIGTNAPSELLEVKGNMTLRGATNLRYKIANDSNNNWAEIGNDGATGENTLEFFTGSSSVPSMSITNSKLVGIGTATPVYTLQANGTNGGIIGVTRTTGNTTGTLGHVRFGNTDVDSDLANIKGVQDGATDSARLEFETQATGGSATARLTIKSDGVVDINSAKLKINGGSGTDGQVLTTDGAGGIAWETSPGAGSVDGSGTADYVAKWSDSDTIANSVLRDDGNRLAVGAAPSSGAGILHLKDVTSNQAKMTLESANAYNSWINFSAASDEMSIGYDKSTVGGFVFANADALNSNIRMVILSTGYVGVGTASPDTLFHMRGAAATLTLESTGNTDDPTIMLQRDNNTGLAARIQLDNSGGDVFFDNTYDNDNGDIYFRTKGTTKRVTIKGSGSVGIGTDAPAVPLHIHTDSASGQEIMLENDGSGEVGLILRTDRKTNGALTGWIGFDAHDAGDNNTRYATIEAYSDDVTGGAEDGRLTFSTMVGATDTETMHIVGGNVGIATAAPTSKLHVYGSNAETTIAKIDGSLRMGVLNSYIKGPNEYKLLRFTNAGLVYNEDGAAALDFRMEGDADINLFFLDASADKVGIGTNAPETKLHVEGSNFVGSSIKIERTSSAGTNEDPGLTFSTSSARTDGQRLGGVYFGAAGTNYGLIRGEMDASTGGKIYFVAASQTNAISNTAAKTFEIAAGTITAKAAIRPLDDSSYTLGQSSLKWSELYVDSIKDVNNNTGSANQVLSAGGSGGSLDWVTLSEISGVDGSGTANYIPKWTDSDTIGNSTIYTDGQDVAIGSTAFGVGGTIDLSVGSPGSTAGGITLWNTTTGVHSIGFGDANSGTARYEGYLEYSHADNSMRFGTVHAEQMRINNLGYVGINTTTPATELHAHGTTLTGRTSGDTGSYVANSYDLIVSNGGSGTVVLLYNDAGAFQSSLIKYDTNCLKLGLNNSSSTNAIWTTTAVNVGSVGVGIGTVTPGGLLEVYAAAGLVASHVKSGTVISRLTANSSASDAVVGTSSAHDFLIQRAGSTRMTFSGSSVVVNDSGEDIDFRVEGDTDTNLIRTDAANERVGIGTNAPSSKLHVNSEISCGADDNNRAMFGYTPSRFYLGTRQSGTNYLNTVSVTSGKVGIGTNAPAYTLQVAGNMGVSQYIFHNDDADTFINFTDDDINFTAGDVNFIDLTQGGTNEITFNEGGLDVDVRMEGDTNANLFFLDASVDKIGIGTNAPNSRLDVLIAARSTTFAADNGATWHDLIVRNPDNTQNAAVGLAFELNSTYHSNAAAGIAAVKEVGSSDYGAGLAFVTRPQSAVAVERVRITASGSVGIGTASPSVELVTIGNVIFRHDTNSPAGYVSGTDLAVFGSHSSTGTLFEIFAQDDTSRFKILGSGATNVNGNINFETMGQYLTFYGGGETEHSISSRNSSGNAADDLRINTFGALFINLDSNNNNTSGADFSIGRHGQTGALSDWLLDLSGETGKLQLNKYGSGTHTGTLAKSLGVDSSGNVIEFTGGTGTVTGSGTDHYIPRWNGTTALQDSSMIALDSGYVGIGTATPGSLLTVSGNSDDGDAACTIAINDEDSTVGSKIPAIQFYGGGTTQGRIRGGDAAFSIAVGSSPTTALSINTANGYPSFTYGSQVRLTLGSTGTAETNDANWIRANGANLEFNAASGDFNWEVGGAHKMRLTDSGVLGVGLGAGTDPFGTIHANGTNGGIFQVTRTSGGTTSTLGIVRFGNTDIDSNLINIKGIQDGATDSARLEFQTQPTGGATVTRMTIKSDGKVGVGTDSPGRIFTVQGGSGDNLPARIIAGASTTKCALEFQDPDTTADYKVTLGSIGDNMFFQAGGSERARILSSGFFGIGTGSPSTKLNVHSGDITITSGKQLISTNSYTQAPPAMLTTQGPSTGATSLGTGTWGIMMGPQHSRSTTANTYYPGIAFNHLLNNGGAVTYNNHPQAWIGTRLHDTPGSERAFLVFSTKGGTGVTASDVPLERMCIDPVDGFVGIGTTNPQVLLDVYTSDSDTARFESTSTSRSTVSIRSGSAGDAQIRFQNGAASKWSIGNDGGDSDKFKIAVGSGAFVATEAFTITTSGSVGIGIGAPSQLLHVNGGSDANLRLTSASTRSGVFIDKPGTTTIMGSALVLADETYKLGTASYYHVIMYQGGATYLLHQGNTKIQTTATGVTVTGTLTETSSITLKENVETYTPSLDIINKIRPVKYNRKTNKDKKEIGLIAEELAELFPELVEKDEKGNPSSVNYSRAVTVLLGGFKELYKEIEQLKKRI